MSLSEHEEEKIVEFLARVYQRIAWQKIRTRKIPWDIFNHRVRAAARQGTLFRFASRLANYFGLQHLPMEAVNLLVELRLQEVQVLNAIYTEHVPLCMLAIQQSKNLKGEDSDKKN